MDKISRTVLIVNDSSENQESYQRFLLQDSRYSYTILQTSFAEGLNLWQQQPLDIILLEYQLPNLGGLEFLTQLQRLNTETNLPVILLVEQGSEAIVAQAMQTGAHSYLIKEQLTAETLRIAVDFTITNIRLQQQLQERETALQESEERLRSALEATRTGIWDWNIQTGKIQWSDNLESLFGLKTGEFDGSFQVFADRLHPDDRDRVQAAIDHALTTGEDYEIEFRVVYPNGRIRWALSQGRVFYNHDGQPIRMVGNDIDITERKQTEAALREGEQRYAALAKISPVGIFRTDVHGDCLYANDLWCQLAGLSPVEAQGQGWLKALHPDDRDRVCTEWYRAAELNLPFHSEYRFQTPDGVVSWLIGQATAERDVEGNLIGYVGTVTNITARKQVEKALQNSEKQFRQLAENIEAVFWIKDMAKQRVSYVSPTYQRLWSLNPQELYEDPKAWVNYIHPEDRQSINLASWEQATAGQFDEEYRIVLPDGQIRWVHDRCFPLYNETGDIYRLTGIAEDITDRKRSEQALRESEERFRTAVENMLDCFAIYQAMRNEQGEIVDFRTEYVNDAACLSNQLTREQQIGRGLCELLPGHRDSGLFDEYCQVVETGQSLVKDSLIYEDDYGQQRLTRAFDIRIAKFGDGYIATWRDITERRQIEEALRKNEELLQLALAGAQAGSWDWEISTGRIAWSPENYALYGITSTGGSPQYEEWFGTLHPDDRECTDAEVLRVIEEKLPEFRAEFRVVHPQRGVRWLLGLGRLSLNEQGEPMRLSGINLDITNRKQSEAELLESERQLRIAKDAAALGIHDYDVISGALQWDSRVRELWGVGSNEPITYEVFFAGLHPEDRAATQAAVNRALDPMGDGKYYAEYRVIHRTNGMTRWISATGIAVFEHERAVRLVGTVQDITERKQSEVERDRLLEQEQAARESAERANRIKDEFLAILSHELRSPLNPIGSIG